MARRNDGDDLVGCQDLRELVIVQCSGLVPLAGAWLWAMAAGDVVSWEVCLLQLC